MKTQLKLIIIPLTVEVVVSQVVQMVSVSVTL